jgi:hypothetical protein
MFDQTLPPIQVTVPRDLNELHRWARLIERLIDEGVEPDRVEDWREDSILLKKLTGLLEEF